MIDITKYQQMPPQGTSEWHLQRLGKFNASRVSELIVDTTAPKLLVDISAPEPCAEVADGPLYRSPVSARIVLWERNLDPEVLRDDEQLWIYLELVSVQNKYMRWGSEHEQEAREIYETRHLLTVEQVGSVNHPDIANFACSPDGLVMQSNSGIEIKCPLPKTYWEWRTAIHDAESLKAVKPEYYWQIMAQIDICVLDYVDFVAYCPLMANDVIEAAAEARHTEPND